MIAKEAISPLNRGNKINIDGRSEVSGGMHLLEVLPRLLDTGSRELSVVEETLEGRREQLGIIDQSSMLEALGRMLPARHDCSIITVDCPPADYSASRLAHAVEDTDAHLVDLLTSPGDDGRIRVTLRVRSADPSAAAASLERYGYSVEACYADYTRSDMIGLERLLELKTILEV